MLVMAAESALRDTPAKLWDSVGWKMYLLSIEPLKKTEDEALSIWCARIDAKHKKWTHKFRQYSASGGIYAKYNEAEEAALDEKAYKEEIEAWEILKIEKIERINMIIKFFLKDGKAFETSPDGLFSQAMFRRDCFIGTSIVLNQIKAPHFAKFISSLNITVIENTGDTLIERVEECLESLRYRLKGMEVEDSPKVILSTIESRSMALTKEGIYFKLSLLLSELKKDDHGLKTSQIIAVLRDLEAENIKDRKFNYWKYILYDEPTDTMGDDDSEIPF